MTTLLEWAGLAWAVLTALTIGFVALAERRSRQRAAASQPAVASPDPPVLSSGDPQPAAYETRELDVGDEVGAAWAQFRALAQRQHVELQVTTEPRLVVRADPAALRRMLAGMLVQAVERAAGRAVLLSAGWHGGRVQVTVTDDGPPGDHATLVGKLREVEQCAALQGGTLEIECWKQRGNRVVLRMPGKLAPETHSADGEATDEADARDLPWTGAMEAS